MASASTNSPELAAQSEIASDSLMMGIAFALILTVIQRLVGFVRNILFCRFMTDEQLGQWSLIYSFILLLAPLAVIGLPGCFGRFVEHYQRRGQLATFLKRINWICGGMTAILAAFLFAFPDTLSWIIFRETGKTEIIYAVAVTLIGITLINYLTSLMEALRQVRIVTIMRFLAAILFTIVALTFLSFWENATSAVTWGFGIGSLLACIPAFWFLWKNRTGISSHGEQLTQKAMWKRIAPFAAWMWMCNLLQNLTEVADRYMLIHFTPVSPELAQSYVGQYHSGRVIPLVLIGIATMLGGVLMPYMTADWERGRKDKAIAQINWTIKLIALGFTLIGAGVLVFAPYLFNIVLQGRYDDGLAVLPLTIIYCIWFSLFIVAQDFLWVAEKGKYGVAAAALGLAINIGFNAVLIPQFGLWGAVWATTIANGLTLIAIYLSNYFFGAKPDLGCWMTASSPLILLLPSLWCLPAMAILIVLAGTTNTIFSNSERDEIEGLFQSIKNKLAKRKG